MPKLVVLVVEDEYLVRLSAADSLRDAGYDVLEANDSDEALDHLRLHPEIGMLFTDVQMPGPMDGLTLARTVRASRPNLGVIVASGRVRPLGKEIPERAVFFEKPYRMDAVIKTIDAMTTRH